MTERWRDLLDATLAEPGATKASVAARLGVSRPYVSRVISGDMDPVPKKFIARVEAILDSISCPYTGRDEPKSLCRDQVRAAPPTHNPFRLAHWHACQRCAHKPEE